MLLVDPYNDHPQIATFRSTKTVDVGLDRVESDNDIFDAAICRSFVARMLIVPIPSFFWRSFSCCIFSDF